MAYYQINQQLRAAIAAPGDDDKARGLLMPRRLDGSPARPASPPPEVDPRIGAVLALLYWRDGELMLPLTLRGDQLTNHRGEVSLPGGRRDPQDASLEQTALRESWEELGIPPESVQLWGALTPVYIRPSNFLITPYVGYSQHPPELRPHPGEVAAVLELPLRQLLRPNAVVVELWERDFGPTHVPFYPFEQHKIWGATAIVLSQLLARVAPLLGSER